MSPPRPSASRRLTFDVLESRRVLAANLLIAGIDALPRSETNHASISVIDLDARETSPIMAAGRLQIADAIASGANASFNASDDGLTGLAIDSRGRLFASISPANVTIGNGRSELIVRDSILGSIVRQVPLTVGGLPVEVSDLAINLSNNQLFGVTSTNSQTIPNNILVRIDTQNGVVTPIGETSLAGNVSIAFDSTGTLWATAQVRETSPLTLHRLNSSDGAILTTQTVISNTPFGVSNALAVDPTTGMLYGSETILGRLFTIDTTTLIRNVVDVQAPIRGITGDLAFDPTRDSDDVRQLFRADFEPGEDRFTVDNSGGVVPGLWHHTIGRFRDGELNHSLDHAFYYGLFEGPEGGGHTVLNAQHQGVLISPTIDIPATGTSILSFNYLLETRPELTRDFVTVSIDNGTAIVEKRSRTGGTLPQTIGDWLTATIDLSEFAGQAIQVRFNFNSGDEVRIDPEGWYVDDVIVVHFPATARTPQADVSVNKVVVDNPTPFEGQTVTFLVTASNSASSPDTATNVIVNDLLPAGFVFQTATPSEGTYNAATGIWDGLELTAGESQTLRLVVLIGVGTENTKLTNNASIIARQFDPNLNNNQATASVDVQPDPSIEKTVDKANPIEGNNIQFTITVTNTSTVSAPSTRLQVLDKLPLGLTFISEESPVGDYDPVTGIWNNFTLPASGSAALKIIARTNTGTGGTPITNVATLNRKRAEATINPIAQPAEQIVQFITPLSVFRKGPLFEPNLPESPVGQITGFLWTDIDVDGVWDGDEPARAGFRVFLDLNNNGAFDAPAEPAALSDLNGRYSFSNLTPGEYAIREVDFDRGTTVISTFPTSGVHTVVVDGTGGPQGNSGVAAVPNFGAFELSTLVRPANQFVEFFADHPNLLRSLIPWQSFQVKNDSNVPMVINELDLSSLEPNVRSFVTIVQLNADGSRTTAALPISVAANEAKQFLVLYDPAIRVNGNVREQSPDWLILDRNTHTFRPTDRLVVKTDIGLSFPVKLVGGSTYDSDVSHDGMVDQEDFTLIRDVLINQTRVVRGDVKFDPTLDINARCPNGADAVTGLCNFGSGNPVREIALGDLGPLNVERTSPTVPRLVLQKQLPPQTQAPVVMMRSSILSDEPASELQWVMNDEFCSAEPTVAAPTIVEVVATRSDPLLCVVEEFERDQTKEAELDSMVQSILF